jgi:hypothetical protein
MPWHLPKLPSPTKAVRRLHHVHFNVQSDFPTSDLMSLEQGFAPQNIRSYFPHLDSVFLLLKAILIAALYLRCPRSHLIPLLLLVDQYYL